MAFRAARQDADALDGFLAWHAATSMFLRGKLDAHGTQEDCHRHGTTFFLKRQDGVISAVAGITNGGYLMCQAPDQQASFWQDITACMAERQVLVMTGVPAQMAAWAKTLGLMAEDFKINDIEPLFEARLSDLVAPPAEFSLRKPVQADAQMLCGWVQGYHRDTGMKPVQDAAVPALAQSFTENKDARIGMVSGSPVAMTSINARAGDMVQVGGVYVPPSLRGRGYGGAVVAAQMAELAREGTQRAVLFAASDAAARAYVRIGFRQVGSYRMALLKKPLVIGAARAGYLSLREG